MDLAAFVPTKATPEEVAAMMTNPPCTAEETRAVVRLREVGVIPALLDWPDSLRYAREHSMITPYLTTEAALKAQEEQRTAAQMPNAAILPGAVKGDGEWVVEALATLLGDLFPKLSMLRHRAETEGEEEAQELAGALLYTMRVGLDNLEIIIADTKSREDEDNDQH